MKMTGRANDNGRGFFSHHGLWAPGVRLFRNLPFRAKAALVTIAFLCPIALLGLDYYESNGSTIEFTAKELLGVDYARASMPVLKAVQSERRAARVDSSSAGAEEQATAAKAAFAAAFTGLKSVQDRVGAELATNDAYKKLDDAVAEAAKQQGQARADALDDEIDALLDTWSAATDGSNLTLDPEMASYYAMDAATVQGPQVTELVERLRAVGEAVLTAGAATPAQARVVAQNVALLEFHFAALHDDLAKAAGKDAALAARLKFDDAYKVGRTFIALARSDLMSDAGIHGTRAEFAAAANTAYDAAWALNDRSTDVLGTLLQLRMDREKAGRNVATTTILVCLGLAMYLFHSFYLVTQGGLREVRAHLKAMTNGDLTTSPRPWGRDEAAELMVSLATMQESLRAIVSRVRASSSSIANASSEIAAGSVDLSARTEKTAASLEESASSTELIATNVKQTAESVREAAQAAADNSQSASASGDVISQVIDTMRDINASSKKISEIIGTIDGIAFQTNILALNAAVEAARAGDQDRGFAVVASEVRNLAQRSAQAAREIKTLITNSVEHVESGARVAEGAGSKMQGLVDNAKRINDLLSEIAAAAAEQSSGVAHVGFAVGDLNRTTQQNAALVEQTAASAAHLKELAHHLEGEVAKFRLPADA